MSDQNIVQELTSSSAFENNYNKVLTELDALRKGVFDESEAPALAALCLITQAGLSKQLCKAESIADGLKHDIKFAIADAYFNLKNDKQDGVKITETSLGQLVYRDPEVKRLYSEQNTADKEFKDLDNIMSILKDAHITFRMLVKKGVQ